MRLLLDTNVLIALEDLPTDLTATAAAMAARLSRLASNNGVTLLTHPSSRDDFARDSDELRRFVSLAKSDKYPPLESPPVPSEEFISRAGGLGRDNDRVDVDLLYAIQAECANFLVTEDRGLYRRARAVGLGSRVYYVEQAVEALAALFEPVVELPPTVDDEFLYNIDLDDPIFQSLRSDYDFDKWYREKSAEGRKAWVIRAGGAIHAICIYKVEEPKTSRTLKLCTFKVGEDSRGRHLGELLLKMVFSHCVANRYASAYVEVLPKPELAFLTDFLEKFGFERDGLKPGTENDEAVYRKRFAPVPAPGADRFAHYVKWAPAFDRTATGFYVPVRPEYHELLFPDATPPEGAQLALSMDRETVGGAVGNALCKAYLSWSRIDKIEPGDLLLFYRSRDDKVVTTIGIVEELLRSQDADEIAGFVGKRTVYSYDVIAREAKQRPTLAILFRQIQHLARPVPSVEAFPSRPPQSIAELEPEVINNIMELGRVDPA